jgi:hypothetical protein
MADPRTLSQTMCAFMNQRGNEQAIHDITANGGALTADERYWVEIGVAFGITAALETLADAGWITGPT